VLAALSLYAQIGFSDPILGGSATSAALLLSVGLIAVTLATYARPPTAPHPDPGPEVS